ncbi:MAG: thiosulfate oxidation carrier complex protein SoxZ [Proteobacteria bacterium]|nr:thiosulfate oxidation carrier complex protein SoxZ [Pseudomonadota bacterium]
MSDKPVKIRGRAKNGVAEIKCLMPHPMETGTRKDADGAFIPAHYIETVVCKHNGKEVMTAEWGASVSKDPYFAFTVRNAQPGDIIEVSWTDNQGQSSSGELVLK